MEKAKRICIYGFVRVWGLITSVFLIVVLVLSFLNEQSMFSLSQYKNYLLNNSDFWFSFWNSCGLSVPILLGTIGIGTLGGYGLAKFRFCGHGMLLTLYILFMMIPFQVLLAPQYRLLYLLNMTNHEMSVILPNIFSPFGVYLIYNYALQLDDSTLEAAKIDGCGEVRIFFYMVVPQLKNGIAALAMLNLIDTWNLIEQPMIFLAEEYQYPLAIAMNSMGEQNFAGCVVYMIPILLIFLLGKDFLIDGLEKMVVR